MKIHCCLSLLLLSGCASKEKATNKEVEEQRSENVKTWLPSEVAQLKNNYTETFIENLGYSRAYSYSYSCCIVDRLISLFPRSYCVKEPADCVKTTMAKYEKECDLLATGRGGY